MAEFECWQQEPHVDYGWIRCRDYGNRVDITAGARWVSLAELAAQVEAMCAQINGKWQEG